MEQPKGDIGTKKDLVVYRLQTAKADLKSARILLPAGKNLRDWLLWQMNLYSWLKSTV